MDGWTVSWSRGRRSERPANRQCGAPLRSLPARPSWRTPPLPGERAGLPPRSRSPASFPSGSAGNLPVRTLRQSRRSGTPPAREMRIDGNSCILFLMTPRLLSMLLLLGTAAMARIPDRSELRGIVTDAATGQTLAAANVRVLGSSLGTICNADGRFALSLAPGTYTVVVSSLGYRPDTLRFELDGSVTRTIALQPSEILLPEVVVTSEDPALAIIRRAIENKRKWAERLATYEMEAFTRQTVRRDTAIAAIAESYTRGYWQRGDTLREVVLQRRQTANLGAAENFAAVGRILNFNEDRIRFVGFTFVGPTADDALDYYDYRLVRTRTTGEGDLFEIRMTPRSRTVPLFTGTVMIADGSYALVGVDVEPNEAFVFPFVRERILRYRQQFSLYDRTFWMPADIRVEGRFRVSLLGFTIPVIGIEQTSVIYRYGINVPVPDSVFRKPRFTIDSTATRTDSSFWASTQVLPLNAEEQKAYAGLDSTQRLDVQFRPGGVGMTLGAGGEGVAALLQYLDLGFNRVE
ncbi:carboxypeptidase-like regulatory domain-containing protein, partial [bacterium]|nr:carboxypeptidase-like regulatory domain-containing protein [bacterium]